MNDDSGRSRPQWKKNCAKALATVRSLPVGPLIYTEWSGEKLEAAVAIAVLDASLFWRSE